LKESRESVGRRGGVKAVIVGVGVGVVTSLRIVKPIHLPIQIWERLKLQHKTRRRHLEAGIKLTISHPLANSKTTFLKMKTPLRLAVLALTTLLFVFAYQTHNDEYSTSIPSRLILKSRGYLPQTFFGWSNGDADDSCSLECLGYGAEEDDDVITQNSDDLAEMVEEGMTGVVVVEEEEVEDEYRPQYAKPSKGQQDKIIIMGKMSAEYTDWVEKELPE